MCKSNERSVFGKVVSEGGAEKIVCVDRRGWGEDSILLTTESELSKRKRNFRGC